MPVFRSAAGKATQLAPVKFKQEKELQRFVEQNLEVLLGIRLVATEFTTGEKHGGRIDTLGSDEAGNPVILEYKWDKSDSVVNQGLFYLDWLLDHRGDFVVAAQRTKIGYPEVRRGLVAGLVMTFLRRQVGERHMRELLLGSELINAERAKEIGLVNRGVSQDDLMSEALKFAESALQGAPGALVQTKRLIDELWGRSVKQDVDLALKYHMEARESAEAREGIAAFNEKRKPKWIA